MARVLKRPMFRRGGSTNDGIMSGLVDREQYSNAGKVGQSARDYISQFEPILREFTPKTRLPLGAVGAALVQGTPIKEALAAGYGQFVKRDDAREAAIRKGAVSMGLGQALKDLSPDKRSQIDLKAREEQARQEEAQDKLNLERAKMMQAKEIAEDKLEQNDDHAKMRASVSLAKDGIKQMKSTIMTGEN